MAAAVVSGVASPAAAVPQGPRESGVSLSSDAPGTLDISWDEPTPAPDDYRVIWARVGERFSSWRDDNGNAFPAENSLRLTGLDENTEYKVRVRARYSSAGLLNGPWSDIATLEVAGQPATPSDRSDTPPPVRPAQESETTNDPHKPRATTTTTRRPPPKLSRSEQSRERQHRPRGDSGLENVAVCR